MAPISGPLLRPGRVAVVVAALLVTAVRAEDWPQWRGPNRDGVWHEMFSPGEVKQRWSVQVGFGWSSPVVAQGRVYLTDALVARPKAQERVLCFDEATGQSLWTRAYHVNFPDWAFAAGQEGGPTATPLVAGGKLYILGITGQLFCLDASKGDVLWEKHLDQEYAVGEFRCRASPLLDGRRLILFVGGKPGACVLALDRDTGKVLWKTLDESVSNSSPIIVTAGGQRQLIVWTEESVTSLDPTTGRTWWREPLNQTSDYAVVTPIAQGPWLLVSGLMFRLDPDKPAASIVWPRSKAVPGRILSQTSTAALLDDHVYSVKSSGQFVCLEAGSGKQVWETDKVTGLMRGASVHITPHGNAAFLFTDRGELIRAKLSPQGYQEISRGALVQPVYSYGGRKVAWAPPAYANGQVFARTEKELVCVSLAAGR